MNKHRSHYIKNLLLPCFIFSALTGIFSTLLITVFQWATKEVIAISEKAYDFVRTTPQWIPALIVGAAAIGVLSSFILTFSHSCRGGGIPTSIAAIRGIADFKWIKSVFLLPISALLTFLCGLPLGTEGPCVQMGTALGDGVVKTFGKEKYAGWRRYIMTGGAASAFSLVTGAPITAILFTMEEIHRRFSPLLFSAASISVITGQVVAQILMHNGIASFGLFHLEVMGELPITMLFIPLALGIICGGASTLFTRAYYVIDNFIRVILGNLSVKLKFPIIFACVALIGFFLSEILGTGHSLIDSLFEERCSWHLLVVIFLIRAVLMMVSNTAGITGGIFLPTLAFGAIIGALCSNVFSAVGLVGEEHRILLVVLGMTAFLGATSRIPVTAAVFAIEALSGINNILSVIIAVTSAFLIVEISGLDDFTHTVIKTKAQAIHKNKEPRFVEVPLTVRKGSFVIDKEVRDILWPSSCVVLSIERQGGDKHLTGISEGDVITVHYKTYDTAETAKELEVLVGDQSKEIDKIMYV